MSENPFVFTEQVPKEKTEPHRSSPRHETRPRPDIKPKIERNSSKTINKTKGVPGKKAKHEFKLGDYETKMQALTGCYFIFEKVIVEHKEDFSDFISNYTLNKTEFYTRLRVDHIEKCLSKISEFNVSRVNSLFFS